jgi:hypothetical protein
MLLHQQLHVNQLSRRQLVCWVLLCSLLLRRVGTAAICRLVKSREVTLMRQVMQPQVNQLSRWQLVCWALLCSSLLLRRVGTAASCRLVKQEVQLLMQQRTVAAAVLPAASDAELAIGLPNSTAAVSAQQQQQQQEELQKEWQDQPADHHHQQQQQQQQHRKVFAPNELTAEAAAAFEQALPAGLLPPGWQQCSGWHELEAQMCFDVGGAGAAAAVSENIRQYQQALTQAQAATAAVSKHGSTLAVQHSPGQRGLAGPCHLVPEAAAAFAQALPAGMLPSNWQQFSSWGQLELHVSFTAAGPGAVLQTRRRFKEAQQLAQETTEAAAAAAAAMADTEQLDMPEDAAADEQQQQQDGNEVLVQDQHPHQQKEQSTAVASEAPPPAAEAPSVAATAAAAANGEASGSASDVAPGSSAWNAALKRLLSRDGFSGKEANVKWRVITADGDRLGPFSSADMQAWLRKCKAPKGVSKQQASKAAADPAGLALCGILSCDYSAQRLPGAKFYGPLGALVPAVAGGLRYAAVAKADVVKGVPAKDWNAGPAAAAAAAAPAAPAVAPPAAAPAVSGSSRAQRKQQPSPTQGRPQLQPPQQQRHRLARSSSSAVPSFAAAAAGDVQQQANELLLVDPGTIQPADLSSEQALQLSGALGALLPPGWQAMRSWAEVIDSLRCIADYAVQLQAFNSLRRQLQLAAARDRSVELVAAEEAQLAAALELSEKEAAAERRAKQWEEPAWLQEQQQLQDQPAGYAAAVARGPAAATEVTSPAAAVPAAAAAAALAKVPASPWEGVSSQQARPGSSPWSTALPAEAAAVDGTSAVAGAGMMHGYAAMGALGAAAPTAAGAVAVAPEWKVHDSPLPASGISGMPAAALPYGGQQRPWQGFDAAAFSHHVPVAVHAAPATLVQHQLQPQQQLQQQQQLAMPIAGGGVAPLGVHMLPPGFAGVHGMPAVVPGPPPGYAGPAPTGMPPAQFRMPPGFSHSSVTQQLPAGFAGAGYGLVPGMPPGYGSHATVRPPPGYQGVDAMA